MTDHCPSCPFKGCPDCRYQGGTHDPSSLINHEGRPVDAAARVLYELRHPPDDECPHIPWEDTYQPGWRDDVLPLITELLPRSSPRRPQRGLGAGVVGPPRAGREADRRVMGAMDLAGAVPGVEFARRTQHKRCHEHCVEYLVCPHMLSVDARPDGERALG